MSWLFSQALVEEYLGDTSLDGAQSVPLSGSHTQQAYCAPDKMTAFSRPSRFGMTFKPLTADRGEELLTLYREGFHAKTLAQQEKAKELTVSAVGCGKKWRASFTKYDPDLRLWKTHQCSLVEDLDQFLETWPQWGLMRDGECWEQRMLEQTIRGTESGSLLPTPTMQGLNRGSNSRKSAMKKGTWPTPRSCSAMAATITPESAWNKKRNPNLETIVGQRMWPTPTAHNAKETNAPSESERNTPILAAQVGGQLNPMWIEWLMGWPLGWTDLKPLAMDKYPSVQQQHGKF